MAYMESIVAAARRLITRPPGTKDPASTVNGLSSVAWDLYETIPEVGAYGDYISHAMGGAVLFAGRRGPDGTVERAPDNSRAAQLVSAMAGGFDGQSVMLGDAGIQLSVAGELWLVILPGANARPGAAGED